MEVTIPNPHSNGHVRQLADAFAREPELILACLEGLEPESPPAAQRILAAACQALTRHPDYADLNYFTSRAAIVAQDHELAETLLRRALEINPGYKDAALWVARLAQVRARSNAEMAPPQPACAAGPSGKIDELSA